MRPTIAVTGSRRRQRATREAAVFAVRHAGGSPTRLLPGMDAMSVEEADGLVITGGTHVHPERYRAQPSVAAAYDRVRDSLELDAVSIAIRRRIPVLAICRGMHLVVALLGGSLEQDIWRTLGRPRRDTIFARHRAQVSEGTRLAQIVGTAAPLRINRLHGQAVGELGPHLVPSARDDAGIVAAVEPRNPAAGWLLAVQWHPELLLARRRQRHLFRSFVDAARSPLTGPVFGHGMHPGGR